MRNFAKGLGLGLLIGYATITTFGTMAFAMLWVESRDSNRNSGYSYRSYSRDYNRPYRSYYNKPKSETIDIPKNSQSISSLINEIDTDNSAAKSVSSKDVDTVNELLNNLNKRIEHFNNARVVDDSDEMGDASESDK